MKIKQSILINNKKKLASIDNLEHSKKVIFDKVSLDYNRVIDNLPITLDIIEIKEIQIINIPKYGSTCFLTKKNIYIDAIHHIFNKLPFGCKIKIQPNFLINWI